MTIYNREDPRTALPQLEKSLNEKILALTKENETLKKQFEVVEYTLEPSGCSLGAYNCCYRIGRIVLLGLNFNITTATSSFEYMSGLPKPIHAWGCTANPTGSVNTTRFYITTEGRLKADGAVVAGWHNGSVAYVCAEDYAPLPPISQLLPMFNG